MLDGWKSARGVAVLLIVWGCHEGPAPQPAQTESPSHARDADGGRPHAEDEDAGSDHHVSVGSATKHAEAGSGGRSGSGAAGKISAAGQGGTAAGNGSAADGGRGTSAGAGAEGGARAGAGGMAAPQAGASSDADHAGEGGSDAEPDDPDDQPGSGAPAPTGGAGGAGARDPINVIWDLARQTPQGMNAEIIRKYLEALGSGDMPAQSIIDFLHSVDAEAHCTQAISTQCIAACEVVGRACAACLVAEDCRSTLRDVCGPASVACR